MNQALYAHMNNKRKMKKKKKEKKKNDGHCRESSMQVAMNIFTPNADSSS
jgi:hypothetical protein